MPSLLIDKAILSYLGGLAIDELSQFIAIGGLPRSGTSYCERWLHTFDGIFVADEFHGLYDPSWLSGMLYKINYIRSETELWTAATGETWRGTTIEELEQRRIYSEIINLLLFTRSSKFRGKKPQNLRIFGFKLPLIERSYKQLWPIFSKTPIPFIYCARDPVAVFVSQWTMPWVSEIDEASFSQRMAQQIRESLQGLDDVFASNCPVAVWRTPANDDDGKQILADLGLMSVAGPQKRKVGLVDEWPKQRRRAITPMRDETVEAFANLPEVKEYRARLRV